MNAAGAALSLPTPKTAHRASSPDRAPQQKLLEVEFNLSRIGATEINVKEDLGQTLGGEQSQKISENNPPYFQYCIQQQKREHRKVRKSVGNQPPIEVS